MPLSWASEFLLFPPFPQETARLWTRLPSSSPHPTSSPPPNQKAPAPIETQIHSVYTGAAGARRMWLAYCSLFTNHLPRFASCPVPWNFKGRQRTRERKGAKEGQRTSRLCKEFCRPRMWREVRLRESRASRPRGSVGMDFPCFRHKSKKNPRFCPTTEKWIFHILWVFLLLPDWPFSRKPGRLGAPMRPWVFVRPRSIW